MARWSAALVLVSLAVCPAVASDFYVEVHGGVSEFDGIADSDRPGSFPAEEVPIDGLPFESSESTWSVLGGWQLTSWFALEAGYSDLGQSSFDLLVAVIRNPTVSPSNRVTLDIDQWFLGTRFSAALSESLYADWALGVTRSEFDVDGSAPTFGPDFEPRRIPFASPGTETGATWGFGFRWQVNPRFAVGINYRQHDTGVVDVEAFTAGLRLSL